MSPSEDDLRASLRRGEGDRLDADRMIAAGGLARAQRRNRITGVAASVVVVAAAAILTGVLVGRGGDTDPSDDAALGSKPTSSSTVNGILPGEPNPGATSPAGPAPSAGTDSSYSRSSPTCPAAFPRRLLPGGGSSQFGGGPLFSSDAVSILVCSYGTSTVATTRSIPGRLLLTGSDAGALQRSLDAAPKQPVGDGCAAPQPSQVRNLAFVPIASDGSTMRVITAMLPGCGQQVTNGSAVRFSWQPATVLEQRLLSVKPDGDVATLPSRSPSGKKYGSPTR